MPNVEEPNPLVAMRRRISELEQGMRDIRSILEPVKTTPKMVCDGCRDEFYAARRVTDRLLGYEP